MTARFLTWVAGGREDVLSAAPGERARYATLGGAVLSTAVVAAVSATFAFRSGLGLPVVVAIVVGLGWGFLILNLDRALVVGISRQQRWWWSLGLALPRVAIAVVLGVVISTPVVLQVFDREIRAEIPALQQQQKQGFDAEQTRTYSRIPELEQRIAAQQAVVQAQGRPASAAADADVIAAQAALTAAQQAYDQASRAADCEASGACGSGQAGRGEVYRQKEGERRTAFTDLQEAQSTYDAAVSAAQQRLAAGAGSALADARDALAADQRELDELATRRAAEERGFLDRQADSEGILVKMEALHALGRDHADVRSAETFLFLLFLAIELLPVVLKIGLSLGARSHYDELLELRNSAEKAAASSWPDTQAQVEGIRRRALLKAVQDETDRRLQIVEKANNEVAAAQASMMSELIEVWRRKVTRTTQQQLADLSAEPPGPPPEVIDLREPPAAGTAANPPSGAYASSTEVE